VIGNGGGDMGVEGCARVRFAYDLGSGALLWRFFTVPGAPGAPFEHPELELAARTWDPQRNPDYRGGGTVWDGMAYDPELNLLYIGTGNAAPYDSRQRGRTRQDNLFVASIIALNADSGRMAWYYQATPGDEWDYDAVQKFVLAELNIAGKRRKVLMQANKNGFFYVLDRATGKLYSARNLRRLPGLAPWTSRPAAPVLAPAAEYTMVRADVPERAGCAHVAPDVVQPRVPASCTSP